MEEDLESVLNTIMDSQDEILKSMKVVIETLKRIEDRQIKTTAMVKDVQVHEAPVVGSFGTTDTKT